MYTTEIEVIEQLKEKNENLESEKVKYNADFNAMELKYVDIIEWCEEMSFKKSD